MFEGKSEIRATWVRKLGNGLGELDGFYSGKIDAVNTDGNEIEACRATLVALGQAGALRFELVITHNINQGSTTFRADCYEDNTEYPLSIFKNEDSTEILLVCDDGEGVGEMIYFHVF
ncbi:hypothetical protein [Acidithiobacillus sp.]|jgi:hypothetical protein|uniref:hypothetical protein n=1 Tax=Acidithiobacillus sp. TaxID=1872118 RepID=UPI0025BED78C|nr:hypothetical protein [Acidithiobacillus sp.]MCK9189190.1 hypothetical protein [Acidithiobacillus sp.]MCK9359632.1 hypothetical protein [Acidithiobacillus sp.]